MMNNPNYQVNPAGNNINSFRLVCGILSILQLIWAVIQAVTHIRTYRTMGNFVMLAGSVILLLTICFWAAYMILIFADKSSKSLADVTAAAALLGLFVMIFDFYLVGWTFSVKYILTFGQTALVFGPMTALLVSKDKRMLRNAWFFPGILCGIIYLYSYVTSARYAFNSLLMFLNYLFFPVCTVVFVFFFMKWMADRDPDARAVPVNNMYMNPNMYAPPPYMPQQMPQPMPQQQIPPQQMQPVPGAGYGAPLILCRSCGKPLEAGDRFCDNCGTPRQPGFCSGCGNPISPDYRFCDRCGKPL